MRERYIGIMSGTSLDGIDTALIQAEGDPARPTIRPLQFHAVPFPPGGADALRELAEDRGTPSTLARTHVLLGEWYAEAALALLDRAGLAATEITAVGCHGQTVQHRPTPAPFLDRAVAATLQLGDPAVLAERTGIPVVADFRARDLAAGGQGAPLVPLVDFLLHQSAQEGRLVLNLGGIANLTALPAGGDRDALVASDVGPGNLLIDQCMERCFGQPFDAGGATAGRGSCDAALLEKLREADPFRLAPPPKSAGREQYGEPFVSWLLETGRRCAFPDLIATVTAYTADAAADFVTRHLQGPEGFATLIVSGGGARNAALMQALGDAFPGLLVRTTEPDGIPVTGKEALAFAVLAQRTVHGLPGSLPQVTGARGGRVLGHRTPGAAP